MSHIESTPITGEASNKDASHPIGALNEFYHAFNHQNFTEMKSNWLQSSNAVMANPLGGIRRGWSEIEGVYQRIFDGKAKVYVEFYDYSILEGDGFFQAIGKERGHADVDHEHLNLDIRTSRLFLLQGNRYKQIHHHGSIENPQLLNQYQTSIKNTQG